MPLLIAFAALLSVGFLLAMPATPAYAIPIVVNSAGDEDDLTGSDALCDINALSPPGSEVCTLRAAIQTANDTPGEDTITFNILPGPPHTRPDGVRVILVGEATGDDLPELTDPDRTTIDGRSQGTGTNNAPTILIIPSTNFPPPTTYGLWVDGGTATITGVAVGGFLGGILIVDSNGSAVQGTFLGIDPDGSTPIPNGFGVWVDSADNTTIGGATIVNRNVISNNVLDGVLLEDVGVCGCGTQSTKVQGNYIGLNAAGTLVRPNLGNGVHIFDSVDVTIGGAAGEGNVISGNGENGVYVEGFASESNRIFGNRIGTSEDGKAAIGNADNGIAVEGSYDTRIGDGSASGPGNLIAGSGDYGIYLLGAELTTIRGNQIGRLVDEAPAPNQGGIYANDVVATDIGGTTLADRNIISGNAGDGILLEAVCGCGPNTVRGNFIGLNVAGTAAAPNSGNGIRIYEELTPFAPSDLAIGGSAPGEGNAISGNGADGVKIVGPGAWAVEIFGNRIGTNATGTAAVANGRDGISLLPTDPPFFSDLGPSQTLIGSDGPGSANVISGNARHGINMLKAQPSPAGGTVVSRNLIGVNAAGTGPIPNLGNGVLIREGSLTIVARNTIANNGLGGVVQTRSSGVFDGVNLSGNLIFGNQELGIDLAETLKPNGAGDGISNNAPGRPENFPVLTNATSSAAGTAIVGTLTGVPPSRPYRMELFASPTCDLSGNGEGTTYLGGTEIQANGAGSASISVTAAPVPGGQFISATSTNAVGQTSEFSACKIVTAAAIIVTPTSGLITTEAGGTAAFTVRLASLPLADVTIGLASSRPSEATVAPASLTFTPANATTEQTVTVTGLPDLATDGNQDFIIVTAPAVSADPAYSGLDAANVTGQNQDAPTVPTLSIQPTASVAEGTGPEVSISFTVTLVPASLQTVSVSWEVLDGTARVGTDIVSGGRAGVLTFAPGETSKPIVLRVIGDSVAEGTETFSVRIFNAQNAALGATTTASGTITDDDSDPTSCSPRPNVVLTTTRIGTDQLLVGVTAGSGTISRITFASQAQPMQNAVVETIGPSGVITGFGTFTPPATVTQQSFIVRRLSPGQPVLVNLTIEDGCGQWTTFVGAGPTAF